ncbi:GNAT family N-acetyltransferase [Photobacterium sp. CCB-ST2H9]|uniref:GNAT family N-acetyltransferase n=1 Tax=Photobacterium sp. CCB-ST2H9 TaxID=2912855 RepID=UPI0020034A4E|nr:GNAT family N-acetyltransferase [Photobacterium sp. CCB-ST2H9]UTM56216.1 GNAT family N-acetyltransferase [Photobacterium sp. CCB-ST2H9]
MSDVESKGKVRVRKATEKDLDMIYRMGYDTWGNRESWRSYLCQCRKSSKYQSGCWYVLVVEDRLVASLLVHADHFGLEMNCRGIGSVATFPEERGQGFASLLVDKVVRMLLMKEHIDTVLLHCDIDFRFYENLGFHRLLQSHCMYRTKLSKQYAGPIPDYF